MRDNDGQQRSTGRVKLAVLAVIAIILVCAIGYIVGSRAVPRNTLYTTAPNDVAVGLGDDNGAIPTYAGPPPVERSAGQIEAPASDPATAPPSTERSDAMAGSVASDDAPADNGAAQDAGPRMSDADRQGRQEIGDAIQAATQDALDRGGSARWHKDGLSGFAVAGPAIADGEQTCRNAYSTTIRDTGETRAPAIRWCRMGDNGAWAAQ